MVITSGGDDRRVLVDDGLSLGRAEDVPGQFGVLIERGRHAVQYALALVFQRLGADVELAVQHRVSHEYVMGVIRLPEIEAETANDEDVDKSGAGSKKHSSRSHARARCVRRVDGTRLLGT